MHTMHAHTHNTLTFLRCWLPAKFSWYLDPYNVFIVLHGLVKWKKLSCAHKVCTRYVACDCDRGTCVAGWDSQSASYLTNHVKWTDLEEFNHPEPKRNYLKILVPSGAQWFKKVWLGWTTPNSCQENRFRKVAPPRTQEQSPYDPCSLWSLVVQGGSVELNHPELMSNSTAGLVPCVLLWFEAYFPLLLRESRCSRPQRHSFGKSDPASSQPWIAQS